MEIINVELFLLSVSLFYLPSKVGMLVRVPVTVDSS